MKTKYLTVLFVLLTTLQHGLSQNPASLADDPIGKHKLNFAVPDLPAFKALGSEPSTILRPSTPESFSMILSQFYNGDNISLPANFAAELAPWILVKSNKITLSDYREHAMLYSSRISLGTSRDSVNNYNFAVGLRFSVIDKGDLKNDPVFLGLLIEKLKKHLADKEKIRDQYLMEHNITEEEFANNPEIVEKEVAKLIKGNIDEEIAALKKTYKELNWNREKLDIAFATVGYATDSTGSNMGFKSFDGWVSYALPVIRIKGKNDAEDLIAKKYAGQLLVGSNIKAYESRFDLKTYFNAFLNSRLYLGTNRIKGFGELQYSYLGYEESNHLLMTLGGEINPVDGVWIECYAGLERNTGSNLNRSVARFSLKFSIPEKFNLF
jgi:hypothetical protein